MYGPCMVQILHSSVSYSTVSHNVLLSSNHLCVNMKHNIPLLYFDHNVPIVLAGTMLSSFLVQGSNAPPKILNRILKHCLVLCACFLFCPLYPCNLNPLHYSAFMIYMLKLVFFLNGCAVYICVRYIYKNVEIDRVGFFLYGNYFSMPLWSETGHTVQYVSLGLSSIGALCRSLSHNVLLIYSLVITSPWFQQ